SSSIQARCSGCVRSLESPSIVVTFFPTARDTGVTHERTASPSRCTVQAPHCAIPQPYFVPVRCRFSRKTHSSGIWGSTSTVDRFPFTTSVITVNSSQTRPAGLARLVQRPVMPQLAPKAKRLTFDARDTRGVPCALGNAAAAIGRASHMLYTTVSVPASLFRRSCEALHGCATRQSPANFSRPSGSHYRRGHRALLPDL